MSTIFKDGNRPNYQDTDAIIQKKIASMLFEAGTGSTPLQSSDPAIVQALADQAFTTQVNASVQSLASTLGNTDTNVTAIRSTLAALTGAGGQLENIIVNQSGQSSQLTTLQTSIDTLVASLGATGGTFISVQTAATGTNFTALTSQACKRLTLANTSVSPAAVAIEVRRGSSGATQIIPAGGFYTWVVSANANELQIRRQDTSNTQISLTFDCES